MTLVNPHGTEASGCLGKLQTSDDDELAWTWIENSVLLTNITIYYLILD